MSWRRWSAVGAAALLIALMQGTGKPPGLAESRSPSSQPPLAQKPSPAPSAAASSVATVMRSPASTASKEEAACQGGVNAMFAMTPEEKAAAMQRVYDAMASSRDPKLQAAGLLYEITTRDSHGLHIATDSSCRPDFPGGIVGHRCMPMKPSDPSLDTYVWTPLTQMQSNAAVVDKLAQLAVTSSDPVVYALAMHACRPFGQDGRGGACSQLSVAQWARIDGGNAVVWLHMIDEAQKRGDRAGVSEALYRLSQAQTSQYYLFTAGNLVLQNLPAGIAQQERTLAEFGALQATSFWALPTFAGLAKECRKPAIADMNRAQVCERIAEFLVTRDTSAIGATIGRKLGEDLGWPTSRLRDIQLEQRASLAEATAAAPRQAAQGDCRWLRRVREWAVLADQFGEVKAAQEQARRSGVSVDQLKSRYLETQAALAAAASAVLPASSPEPESR